MKELLAYTEERAQRAIRMQELGQSLGSLPIMERSEELISQNILLLALSVQWAHYEA